MKGGLARIPGREELLGAYETLLHSSPHEATPGELALFSQWSRFDPRLAEIWVAHVIERWKRLNPIDLRARMLEQPWPGVAAVLLEFVERAVTDPSEMKIYRLWKQTVTLEFAKGQWEQFFIGQRRLAGSAMLDDARLALLEYRKWGYLAREILFNKQVLPAKSRRLSRPKYARVRTHSLDPGTRREILKALLESSPRIQAGEYWEALGKAVSRRQAERDLERSSLVRAVGNTKGRYYARRSPPRGVATSAKARRTPRGAR